MSDIMNCERLDAALETYLEGELDTPARVALERHASECLRCASLLRGLQRVRSEAGKLPELEPSRDLWPGIAARIEAPVIPLAPAAGRRPAFGLRSTLWLSAAAVLLVAVSVGATYTVTMNRVGRATGRMTAGAVLPDSSGAALAPNVTVADAPSTPAPRGALPVPGSAIPSVVTYDREIAQLRGVLDQRRTDLDPATVAIVENSLATIDRAIADARTALTTDPASAFLTDQLNKALEKKLGLLRTVALMPPRA